MPNLLVVAASGIIGAVVALALWENRNFQHYRSFRACPSLHRAICRCRGRGFRYHILGWGR